MCIRGSNSFYFLFFNYNSFYFDHLNKFNLKINVIFPVFRLSCLSRHLGKDCIGSAGRHVWGQTVMTVWAYMGSDCNDCGHVWSQIVMTVWACIY